jgi:hypothetical protein
VALDPDPGALVVAPEAEASERSGPGVLTRGGMQYRCGSTKGRQNMSNTTHTWRTVKGLISGVMALAVGLLLPGAAAATCNQARSGRGLKG